MASARQHRKNQPAIVEESQVEVEGELDIFLVQPKRKWSRIWWSKCMVEKPWKKTRQPRRELINFDSEKPMALYVVCGVLAVPTETEPALTTS